MAQLDELYIQKYKVQKRIAQCVKSKD